MGVIPPPVARVHKEAVWQYDFALPIDHHHVGVVIGQSMSFDGRIHSISTDDVPVEWYGNLADGPMPFSTRCPERSSAPGVANHERDRGSLDGQPSCRHSLDPSTLGSNHRPRRWLRRSTPAAKTGCRPSSPGPILPKMCHNSAMGSTAVRKADGSRTAGHARRLASASVITRVRCASAGSFSADPPLRSCVRRVVRRC